MELREYIAKRRKLLGVSQSEMASFLGYTDTAVSKIESGASNPPISILPSLANELQLSLDDLLLMNPSPAPFKDANPAYDDQKVAANIRALRLSVHLRQKEAAEKIGVNKRTLATYEKGDACPNLATLNHLLALCPGKPSEFFYGTLFPEIQSSPSFKKEGLRLSSLSSSAFSSAAGSSARASLPSLWRTRTPLRAANSVSIRTGIRLPQASPLRAPLFPKRIFCGGI